MEQEVFRHSGTLDKYLGDGLMATFGTPFVGEADAGNALRCAQAMMAAADRWNNQRKTAGETPIRVSFGLHYGPVVLGDIGLTCLEFAVIGSTVNAASRLDETFFLLNGDSFFDCNWLNLVPGAQRDDWTVRATLAKIGRAHV